MVLRFPLLVQTWKRRPARPSPRQFQVHARCQWPRIGSHDPRRSQKNHPGGENSKPSGERETRLYSTEADDDAFASLKLFVEKLNPFCTAFFQYPKSSVTKEDTVWYENRPLGVNKLGDMMKTISPTTSQMQWRITNLRAQKFPPSPKLHLSKAPTKWPPTSPCRRPQQVFPTAFLKLAIFKETYRSFSARRAAPMTKSDLYFQYFVLDLYILQFNFCFLSDFLFHGKLHLIQV